MDETSIIDAWLYATLTGDQALGALLGVPQNVFPELAPSGTTGAYITFSVMPAGDEGSIGMVRATARFTYQITAWGQDGGYQALQAILSRVDALLQGQNINSQSLTFKVRRTSGAGKIPHFSDNVSYQRVMAAYLFIAQPGS